MQKLIPIFTGCVFTILMTGCAASDLTSEDELQKGMTKLGSDASWESEPVFEYDDQWTFFVEKTPAKDMENYPSGFLSRLMAKDEASGETFDLTGDLSVALSNYKLYAFTDILGSDGVVFEYSAGSASAPVLLFGVGDGIELLVEGDGDVYTGDLDGDGVAEVVWSTVGGFPFTYISWLGKQGTVLCASLDEAVKEELIRSKTIDSQVSSLSLEIRNGHHGVIARWLEGSDGDERSVEVDIERVLEGLKEQY